MTNRYNWNFPYPADKLATAARVKFGYHDSRLTWWNNKRDEVKVKIKEDGIIIDESVAASANSNAFSTSNYGRQPSVQIENGLLQDLTECNNKVAEHKGKMDEYSAWIAVLDSQGATHFNLNQQDWLFFFGK